jgi:hypothetical protein
MFQYRRISAVLMSVCAVFTFAIATSTADASLISFVSQSQNSTEGLGAFEGTMEYVPDAINTTQGLLTIQLINTTHVDIGGFVTGFVFNIDSSDPDATASLTSATHPFIGVTNHPAEPFGNSFTAGAALSGNWGGNGDPSAGIAVGDTGTFIYDIFASDADSLTAESFISGSLSYNFVVRFRGMDDDGSDKVPGKPIHTVPAPGALALLAAAGLIAPRRRKR